MRIIKTVVLSTTQAELLHEAFLAKKEADDKLETMIFDLRREHRGTMPPAGSASYDQWEKTKMAINEESDSKHDTLVFWI